MIKFNQLVLAGTAVLALGLSATTAQAAPASTSAQAKAKVLKRLTITKTTDLDFGTIVTGTAASTVAIAADGTVACGAGLTCSGTRTPAVFNVTGSNNAVLTVNIPASVTLKNKTTGATSTMSADLVNPGTLNLGNSGSAGTALRFGGTLNVAGNQEDGVYESDVFSVTVDYQ